MMLVCCTAQADWEPPLAQNMYKVWILMDKYPCDKDEYLDFRELECVNIFK